MAANLLDNSETVYISSLALLKMLRHGRAGVPMEVMGLMLGEFVDDVWGVGTALAGRVGVLCALTLGELEPFIVSGRY